MDKIQKHMDKLNAAACSSQGGASRGQGPKSAKDPKKSGDAVTNASKYTTQDQSREQGGPPKNKFHDV